MRLTTCIAASLIALTTTAFASSAERESAPEERSANAAMGRALLHTVVPLTAGILLANHASGDLAGGIAGGAIVYGVLVGPSMGNVYLSDASGATLGIVSRSAGSLMMFTGLVIAFGCAWGGGDDDEGGSCNDNSANILFFGGGATFLGGTIWNLARLPAAARHRSHAAAADRKPAVRLAAAPTWSLQDKSVGMRLSLNY